MRVAAAAEQTSRGRPRDKISGTQVDAFFERELVALMPYLQNFARRLCRSTEIAEDVVQDTLTKAWRARNRFEPGTNLKAWLFTILRNEFFSYRRRAWRQTPWDVALGDLIPVPADEQDWAVGLSDCMRALHQLPERQREAVLLVGAGGLSYEDAAGVTKSAVGTLKSRMARGRSGLEKLLAGGQPLRSRSATPVRSGMDEIFAQLTAIKAAGARRAAHV